MYQGPCLNQLPQSTFYVWVLDSYQISILQVIVIIQKWKEVDSFMFTGIQPPFWVLTQIRICLVFIFSKDQFEPKLSSFCQCSTYSTFENIQWRCSLYRQLSQIDVTKGAFLTQSHFSHIHSISSLMISNFIHIGTL